MCIVAYCLVSVDRDFDPSVNNRISYRYANAIFIVF